MENEGDQDGVLTVGLVADPGMPAAAVSAIADDLPDVLGRAVREGGAGGWWVETVGAPLLLDERGTIPIPAVGKAYRDEHGWDLVVLITDLPRRAVTEPILVDFSTRARVAMVSLPALGGGFRLRARLRDLLVHVIGHLVADRFGIDPHASRHTSYGRLGAYVAEKLAPTRHVESPEPDIDGRLTLTGLRGRFRLLRGMVHDNRPWRLVPHLASATAAAGAVAAFGIFYSSIWNMADALPPWRLALINVVAIAVMVGWLIAYNHLWDRPSTYRHPGQAALYNGATVLTLAIGVTTMYGLLYVLSLLAAGAVIDIGYLRSQLGHPVGLADYAQLTWLACSMGIVAGALGTSLESEDAVRQATYSRREQERRARHQDGDEDGTRTSRVDS